MPGGYAGTRAQKTHPQDLVEGSKKYKFCTGLPWKSVLKRKVGPPPLDLALSGIWRLVFLHLDLKIWGGNPRIPPEEPHHFPHHKADLTSVGRPDSPDHLREPERPGATYECLNPLQQDILDAIKADPTATLNELVLTLGRAKHRIRYQLNKMMKSRAIYSRKEGKTLHYFPAMKRFNRRLAEQMVLRDDRKLLILRELCSRETISSTRGFAATLGLDRNFVARVFDPFEKLGLVERKQCGGMIVTRARKRAYQAVNRVLEEQEAGSMTP